MAKVDLLGAGVKTLMNLNTNDEPVIHSDPFVPRL